MARRQVAVAAGFERLARHFQRTFDDIEKALQIAWPQFTSCFEQSGELGERRTSGRADMHDGSSIPHAWQRRTNKRVRRAQQMAGAISATCLPKVVHGFPRFY